MKSARSFGDNDGRSPILSLLATSDFRNVEDFAFGRPVIKETSNKEAEEFCEPLRK